MTTPIGAHIAKALETMRYPVVQLLLIRVGFSIRLADTLRDDLGIAFFMTRIFTVLALHAR